MKDFGERLRNSAASSVATSDELADDVRKTASEVAQIACDAVESANESVQQKLRCQ